MTINQAGTINTTALVVPGLDINIVPPSSVALNGVPTDIIGIVGTASWGPVNQVSIIGSLNAYASLFGPVLNRVFDMGTHVAIAGQQGAQNFKCVRVTDGTDAAATATLVTTCLTGTSKWTGTLGNKTTIALIKGSKAGSFAVVVALPGVGSEKFDNITGSGNAFWVNAAAAINSGVGSPTGPSQIITAAAGAGTTAAAVTAPVAFTGGLDGYTSVVSATLIGSDASPRTGMYILRKQQCSILDICDLFDTTQWTTADQLAQSEGMYNIVTGPSGDTISNATTAKATAGLDSYSTKCLFGDWPWWYDNANALYRLVSPQAFIAGRLANLSPEQSTLNKTLFSVVGSQKVGLPGSTTINQYADADLETLFLSSIDVITNPGAGNVPIWTARLGHNSSSDATRSGDNYTRLINYIATTMDAGMGLYLGQVINLNLLTSIRATLLNFLAAMLQQGLLGTNISDGSVPYKVVCDATNNTQARTSMGYVQADVTVTFQGIVEHLIVNLQGGTTVVTSLQS